MQIAKAQFAVGRGGVNSDCYNMRMKALTTADVSTGGGLPRIALSSVLFDASSSAAHSEEGGSGGGCVRQRKGGAGAGGGRAMSDGAAAASSAGGGGGGDGGTVNSRKKEDPFFWFGGAKPPPTGLRRAQGHFQQALMESVALANLQIEFHAADERYEALMAEKKRRAG
eukprot:SAG22_NODE_78_length_22065_cov_7.473095_13_plen_169_part_00